MVEDQVPITHYGLLEPNQPPVDVSVVEILPIVLMASAVVHVSVVSSARDTPVIAVATWMDLEVFVSYNNLNLRQQPTRSRDLAPAS